MKYGGFVSNKQTRTKNEEKRRRLRRFIIYTVLERQPAKADILQDYARMASVPAKT